MSRSAEDACKQQAVGYWTACPTKDAGWEVLGSGDWSSRVVHSNVSCVSLGAKLLGGARRWGGADGTHAASATGRRQGELGKRTNLYGLRQGGGRTKRAKEGSEARGSGASPAKKSQ